MSVIGIVCEFNPFHNGHKYLIDSVKKDGDSVVCIMSGNFVQRAESAIFDKRTRAETALACGADLVIELPIAFSVSGAQTFARGAVKLLNSLGIADTIAFGSECGDIKILKETVNAVNDERVQNKINELMKSGITFAVAREKAVREIFGTDVSDVLQNSNDILAVEYITALSMLKSKITPKVVKRIGVSHDDVATENEFASASFVREIIKNGENPEAYMPKEAYKIICGQALSNYQKLDLAILAFLRKASAEDFKNIPDVSEGIENRIINASKTATSMAQVFDNAKTKRYTHARIRRIVLCAFLGIKNTDISDDVQYIRVLGFNEIGKDVLRKAGNTALLPVVMRASDISHLSPTAQRAFSLECTATDIFNLTFSEIRRCGTEMTDNLVIIN